MVFKTSAKTDKSQQNQLNMWLASLVVGILYVVIMVACLGLAQKLQHNKERISQLNSEIIKEEQRAADIEEYRQYTETKEYIEEIARKKLGLVYDGEIIFKEETAGK